MDAYDAATGYVVPGVCLLVVAAYAAFDLTSKWRFADTRAEARAPCELEETKAAAM